VLREHQQPLSAIVMAQQQCAHCAVLLAVGWFASAFAFTECPREAALDVSDASLLQLHHNRHRSDSIRHRSVTSTDLDEAFSWKRTPKPTKQPTPRPTQTEQAPAPPPFVAQPMQPALPVVCPLNTNLYMKTGELWLEVPREDDFHRVNTSFNTLTHHRITLERIGDPGAVCVKYQHSSNSTPWYLMATIQKTAVQLTWVPKPSSMSELSWWLDTVMYSNGSVYVSTVCLASRSGRINATLVGCDMQSVCKVTRTTANGSY